MKFNSLHWCLLCSTVVHVGAIALLPRAASSPLQEAGGADYAIGRRSSMYVSLYNASGTSLDASLSPISTIPENHRSSTSDIAILADAFDSPLSDSPIANTLRLRKPGTTRLTTLLRPQPPSQLLPGASAELLGHPSSDAVGDADSTGNGVGDELGVRGGTERARALTASRPRYPEAARNAGFEGEVVLSIRVNQQGLVTAAQIVRESGCSECDNEARATVLEKWRFAPARHAGVAIETEEIVVVAFSLTDT